MKLLTNITDYNQTIKLATNLNSKYNESVIFHCYWNGNLNEKHLYSILSCYYFNVFNNNHKIILWLENNIPNDINKEIKKYCEIKNFILKEETKNTWLENENIIFKTNILTEKSDFYRLLLLYNYGGCWFDLDCFFLRSFDPLFSNYKNDICLYQWEKQEYPNNAIIISLEPKSIKMKKNIEFIIKLNRGWGFQIAKLTYNIKELDFFILPCSWFDGSWISNPYNIKFNFFFKKSNKEYNFENFFKGSFCYHWHNNWDGIIEENSIILQLVKIIKSKLI